MSYTIYPKAKATPAPTTGNITTWGDGIVTPHINFPILEAIQQQPTVPSGPDAIKIRNMEGRERYYENTLGTFPVSAAYEIGGAIIQAFLVSMSWQYENFYSSEYYLPVPSGWNNGSWSVFTPAQGWVYRSIEQEVSPGNWRIVTYSEGWAVLFHTLEPVKSIGITNMVAIAMLMMMFLMMGGVGVVRSPKKSS